ncbi:integrase_H2C2 domain-containing protein [Trichonephila clavipes]|nr:integrase_H2C2 domain-containing protein [Trichonephila clavipes]
MHAGVLTTLAQLREKFWISKGRRVVRAILRPSIKCKRLTAGKVNPDPAPLPPDRIHRVAAFQITGADLAGPLFLRGGSKAWIVLFTCAVYRTVHLELVSSLSTESFMQALRRFWARRERGSMLYTDNGTNFVGAANALKSLDWDFIQAECSLMKIKGLFSPPSAPWQGRRGACGEIIRPLQRIYPLELSASDHLIEDHQGTNIAAQIPGPTAADVLEEEKKSRYGRPLIPVKRLNL